MVRCKHIYMILALKKNAANKLFDRLKILCIFEPKSFANISVPDYDKNVLFEIVTVSLPKKVIIYIEY